MKCVYIDESGDLGRAEKSSRFIVITSIATENPRRLDKIVRKIWTTKQHKKSAGELHAIEASDSTRQKLLALLDELSVEITFEIIDKVSGAEDLHQKYYQTLANQIIHHGEAEVFVVDKRDTNKKRREIISALGLEREFEGVEFADSRSVRQLQAVDFVCWSVFQYVEHGDDRYINTVRRRISGDLQ